mmetsp:Transcript_13695/g.25759  ORF Transcript_13695/g.25759 Transcript_13695/m.25759 type:complete len:987 (+) Transcript_13695:101-3061(+)
MASEIEWPILQSHEIQWPSPEEDISNQQDPHDQGPLLQNAHWNVPKGSSVRVGQLLGVVASESGRDGAVGQTGEHDGSCDREQRGIHQQCGTQSKQQQQLPPVLSPVGANKTTSSSTFIRARKVKKLPNVAPASTSDGSSAINSIKFIQQEKSDDREHRTSSFLGQYLQPTLGSNDNYNDEDSGDSDTIMKHDNKHSRSTSKGNVDTINTNVSHDVPSQDHGTNKNIFTSEQISRSTPSNSKDHKNHGTIKSTPLVEIRAHMDGIIHLYDSIEYRRLPQETNCMLVKVLGYIEPCHHPAVVDGLCAICGHSVAQDQKMESDGDLAKSSLPLQISNPESFINGSACAETVQRNNLTLSGGVTVSVSTEYAKAYATNAYQSLLSAKKLNLVLDLDHTLLHATADPRASSWKHKNREEFRADVHAFWLPLMEGHPMFQQQQQQQQMWGGGEKGRNMTMVQPHYVKLRPHVAEFLSSVMDLYEVTIYTAGTRLYAEKIAQVLSRSVADYQRRLKSVDQESEGLDNCLDEEDLFLLRDQVERVREYENWYRSRKERHEFLERMNEKYFTQPQEQNVDDGYMKNAQNDIATESEKKNNDDENDEDASDGPHMMAGDVEDTKESPKPKNKKRKRVTFSLPDDHENNTRLECANEKTNQCVSGVDSLSLEEDPSDKLRELEEKLLKAEKYEREAQSLRKKIFGSRIISRTDVGDLGRDVKSLKRVFPCGGMMAVIVDDREDVWANANNNCTGRKGEPPENLLFVRPYHWGPFLKFADVNNSSGVDITQRSDPGERNDGVSIEESKELQLLWTRDILRKIHERFYYPLGVGNRNDLTVPGILKQLRQEVFGKLVPSAKFILSGLVPLHRQNSLAVNDESPRPDVVRYAEDMGAEILNKVSRDVTHVVAARDGTDKILRARKIPGCAIVKISWLMECYWSCSLRDVNPHILGNKPLPVLKPAVDKKRPILLTGRDSSEDEDEDEAFFDDFEKEMEG